MSWRNVTTLALALLLGACGFHPLYQERAGSPAAETSLASVRVLQVAERDGQELTTSLRDAFNPTSASVPAAYTLQIGLVETNADTALREDSTASRNMTNVTATWSLKRLSDGKVVANGRARSITSHDVVTNEYANVVSTQQDREHAIRDIGDQIQLRVTLYLQNPT